MSEISAISVILIDNVDNMNFGASSQPPTLSRTLSSEFIRKSHYILQNPNTGHKLSSEISRSSCLKIERN